MAGIPSFDEYLSTLGRMSRHVDPTLPTAAAREIHDATESLGRLAAGEFEAEGGLLAGLSGPDDGAASASTSTEWRSGRTCIRTGCPHWDSRWGSRRSG